MPKTTRVSTSFTSNEVNVLDAMLEAARTGEFKNTESTLTFQHTARKILSLKTRLKTGEQNAKEV